MHEEGDARVQALDELEAADELLDPHLPFVQGRRAIGVNHTYR